MDDLINGVRSFQQDSYPELETLFRDLSGGQRPHTLFITCSDSRVDPSLITQSQPGSLFVIRNAGNMVPPYGTAPGSEAGSVEYAISVLGVQQVVVCGHAGCGAVAALRDGVEGCPAVAQWLSHGRATQALMDAQRDQLSSDELLNYGIEQNVLMQLQHLRTHPAVALALARNAVQLSGWVYDIGSGEVRVHDPGVDRFVPISEQTIVAMTR